MNFLSPEWEGYNREWLALDGTPYGGKKEKWEFQSLHPNKLYNMWLMADVFTDAVKRFLAELQARFTAAGVASVSLVDYNLRTHHAGELDFWYIASIWGSEAKIEFFTRDKALFEDCKTFLLRLPPEEAATFTFIEKKSFWIRKEKSMDARFLNSGSGLVFCAESLRTLALATLQARPELADFLPPLIALPKFVETGK